MSRQEEPISKTEYQANLWDEQFEADVKAGKLNRLAREAEKDFDDGKCTPLTQNT